MAEQEAGFQELQRIARELEKKAEAIPSVPPKIELREDQIVLLSPADIVNLSYYDLVNEAAKVYKYRAAKALVAGKPVPRPSMDTHPLEMAFAESLIDKKNMRPLVLGKAPVDAKSPLVRPIMMGQGEATTPFQPKQQKKQDEDSK